MARPENVPPSQPYGELGQFRGHHTTPVKMHPSATARDSRRLDFCNAPARPLQRRVFLADDEISVRLFNLASFPNSRSTTPSREKHPRHKQATPAPPTAASHHETMSLTTTHRHHPLIIPSPPNADPETTPRKKERKSEKSLQPLMHPPLPLKLLIQHLPIPPRRNRLMPRLLLLVAHQTVDTGHDVAAEGFPDALHTHTPSAHTHYQQWEGGDVHAPGRPCP